MKRSKLVRIKYFLLSPCVLSIIFICLNKNIFLAYDGEHLHSSFRRVRTLPHPFIAGLREKAQGLEQGEVTETEVAQWIKDEARRFPIFTKGIVAGAIEQLGSPQRQRIEAIIKGVIEQARKDKEVVRVIPIGPVGSRSFPFSTQGEYGVPKPLTESPFSETLLAKSIERAKKFRDSSGRYIEDANRVFIVTTQDIYEKVLRQATALGIPEENIIAQPLSTGNTGVASGYMAVRLKKLFGDDFVMSVMTTDHDISDLDGLADRLDDAETIASLEPTISIIGIRPNDADPNMGYIDYAHGVDIYIGGDSYGVKEFKEKPKRRDIAQGFLDAGNLWNSGKFVYRIATLLEAFKQFAPEYYQELDRIFRAIGTKDESNVIAAAFSIFEELNKSAKYKDKGGAVEKTIVEPASVSYNIGVSVTLFNGGWADLGNLHCRWLGEKTDSENNLKRGPKPENITLQKTENSNVLLSADDTVTRVNLFGVSGLAIAYNRHNKSLVVVPMAKDEDVKNLVKSIEANPALRKYLILDNPAIMPTSRVGVEEIIQGSNRIYLARGGDGLISETPEPESEFKSRDSVVFSRDGLVAISSLENVIVIKDGEDIYVYGPEYRAEGEKHLKILRQAITSAEDIIDSIRDEKTINIPAVKTLVDIANNSDPKLARIGIRELFGTVVETLNDSFIPEYRQLYYQLFAEVIQASRSAEGAGPVDQLLKAFGYQSAADLTARAGRISQPQTFTGDRQAVRKVFVLSRVTLGADVCVTSLAIERAKEYFPNAEIILLGSTVAEELFGGDQRTRVMPLAYERRGALVSRFLSWPAAVSAIAEETRDGSPYVIIDPDSRISQVGLLPFGTTDANYFFFDATRNALPEDNISQAMQRWLDEVFPLKEGRITPKVSLDIDDLDFAEKIYTHLFGDYVVSMSLGVGGNQEKRIPGAFEEVLIKSLLDENATVLLGKSSDAEEIMRIDAIVKNLRAQGYAVVEINGSSPATLSGLSGLKGKAKLIVFQGNLGKFAALVGKSQQYIGYDSMGQHVASAFNIPIITLFIDYPSELFPVRWKPFGDKVDIIKAPPSSGLSQQDILDEVLKYLRFRRTRPVACLRITWAIV